MKKGLVLGSFDPIHQGHINLIDFAKRNCDQLIVLVCTTTNNENIDGKLRLEWVKELLKNDSNIKVDYLDRKMPHSQKSSKTVSKVWAEYLKKKYSFINVIFSSEIYGDFLASGMSSNSYIIKHQIYDLNRKQTPVSATKIRKNPFKNWDYIPEIVKPYFVKKICIYGPESTGKSTLTLNLAKHFSTEFVPEEARRLVDKMDKSLGELTLKDLEFFAETQYKSVQEKLMLANKFLFCDTDHITTEIYSQLFFNKVPRTIQKYHLKYDLYLLLDVDVPHVSDEQRNLAHKRKDIFVLFENELIKRECVYKKINGSWDKRIQQAIHIVKELFQI